jgi:hypothetical protein
VNTSLRHYAIRRAKVAHMAQRTKWTVTQVKAGLTQSPYVQITRGPDEWWQVPERIEAKIEFRDVNDNVDYTLEIVTGLDATLSPTIVRAVVERGPDGVPMSDAVRGPLERILAEVVEQAAFRWVRDSESDRWTLSEDSLNLRPVAGAGSVSITRGRQSRKQTALIQQEIEQVASLWPEAQKHPAPIEFIRAQLGMSRRTAQRRKERAQEQRLID